MLLLDIIHFTSVTPTKAVMDKNLSRSSHVKQFTPVSNSKLMIILDQLQVNLFLKVVKLTKCQFPYISAGRYCEWQHITVDKSTEIETFEEYKKTLKLECEPGDPAFLNWTVSYDTPNLVYYQVTYLCLV